ncbi:MAG TPA: nuclear transport factor 2 family protein, partial [Gammaproteobacteria bacterium]|nr:nuclear transport factor 2 family protein [Gammaproteobacteria bacterium]
MRAKIFAIASAAAAAALASVAAVRGADGDATLAEFAARAAALEHDVGALEDGYAIEKLQRIYGFYTDKQLWTQAADLFAANGSIEVGSRGVY